MGDRKPLIAGNWKMYKTNAEAVETAKALSKLVADVKDVDIMIAPPFTALSAVSEVIGNSNIGLGAQNLFHENEGAYTGEISARMLASAGCRYVIIGHSERRQYFGDTDETVNQKIRAALKAKLIPIFCVGESDAERDSEKTFSVLDKQIRNGLKRFSSDDLKTLVIAYEPVWAIGTGKTASGEQVREVHAFSRSQVGKIFGNPLAESVRILYGGSVKPSNIAELMAMPDVDGALVGGASLNAESFARIAGFEK